MSLQHLEKHLERDLEKINYLLKPWRLESDGVEDVVIIGAGMAGMAAAFALLRLGIQKIKIFDQAPEGKEGPWLNFARMKTLRSPKTWMGPALFLPSLTFEAWYEAQFGRQSWEDLGKIPTAQWMEYLHWYGKVLKLPIKNEVELLSIHPLGNHLKLTLSHGEVKTHKVVLATGRMGFGGPSIPEFIKKHPKLKWAHTNEIIDFTCFKGLRIGVLGVGASGFDAAAVALESGAKGVDLFTRRAAVPNVNVERELFFPGCFLGYSNLSDEQRFNHYAHSFSKGSPPPKEALERVSGHPNFHLHLGVDVEKMIDCYDFLILATGFAVDGSKQRELKPFFEEILLWKDRGFSKPAKLGEFPYLGPHFEFREKREGRAPFLNNIYCFNYGSTLSHSGLGSEIPSISYGAERLARGIARDFYLKDQKLHFEKFKGYNTPEFTLEEFDFCP